MRLYNVITIRISLLTILILLLWSFLFYYAIINEVNDETDDTLEDYAEMIVVRSVRNEPLPTESTGSNNQYFIREITPQYAAEHQHVRYKDIDVYIEEKREFEPARVLTYIFQNDDGTFYELEVSTPNIDKTDLKEAIFNWIVILFLAILLSIVLLNLWTIRRSMRPLKKLLKWLDEYEITSSPKPLNNPTRIFEYKVLNDVVQNSLKRTENAYNQQKLFIGNASHEMQTPLAICSNRLELLLEDNSLTESQVVEILKTKQSIDQLSQTNKSLLLLSRIDNRQFPKKDKVNLGEIISKYLPDYQMVFESKNIKTTYREKSPFILYMDESLAHSLVSNLLKNAFVHNCTNGTISIVVDENYFTVKNTGADIALNKDLIFERFYHTPENKGSVGLGLSIVKAICELYKINISYSFEDNSEEKNHSFRLEKS